MDSTHDALLRVVQPGEGACWPRLALLVLGLLLLGRRVEQWRLVDFGPLDYARTMRWVIPGVPLTALGFPDHPLELLREHPGHAAQVSVTDQPTSASRPVAG